jgi:hypothetical protein
MGNPLLGESRGSICLFFGGSLKQVHDNGYIMVILPYLLYIDIRMIIGQYGNSHKPAMW